MVSEADISLGILEGALAGGEPTGYPIFNSPDEVIDSLRDTGIDVVNYANNHIYDYDDEGLQRTIEITKEKGLDVLGIKSTEEEKSYLVKEVDGVKIGFASYVFETETINGYKTINSNPVSINSENLINTFNYNDLESFYNRIASEISAMKAEGVEFIIASMHWGEEYNTYIEATQNEIAKKLISEYKTIRHIIQEGDFYRLENTSSNDYYLYQYLKENESVVRNLSSI